MLRYSSSRHRKLMDTSEYALHNALESRVERESRIASAILEDNRKHSQWEVQHANLLLPVAEHRRKKDQIVALRKAKVQLVHRRAFFNYLQAHEISDLLRQRLFRIYHATKDYHDAILAEHRDYMLAVSSRISTDHIIDVMNDAMSTHLLEQYEHTYARLYEMQCYVACAEDSDCIALVRTAMDDTHAQLLRIRRRIETEAPVGEGGNFDRQEILARSGRYPALNYLNAY